MSKPVRIKFVSKTNVNELYNLWSPLLPETGFEGVDFTFDPNDPDYDFFVVYEGLPKDSSNKIIDFEALKCSKANTLLITTEPSSIRIDGPKFMRQFGHILTSKSQRLTQHPNHINDTPPLRWFYGRAMDTSGTFLTTDFIRSNLPEKTRQLSAVCSTKKMSHTVHAARLDFMMSLRERLQNLDLYGRGIRPISDKAEAMDAYRYHIAIENHIEPGHWTEKLSDCFLAGCLPFYFGDPDYSKAFPERAVIPIDIFDLNEAEQTIRSALSENAYEQRLPDILEARRRVLDDYNTLGWVAKFIQNSYVETPDGGSHKILNRHAFRRAHPVKGLMDLGFRLTMKHHRDASPLQTQKSFQK